MSIWQIELRIPDPAALLPVGMSLARRLREETGSPERVRLEIYRRLGEKRYGFFIRMEATDQGTAAASAVLAAARAYESEGLPAPREITVITEGEGGDEDGGTDPTG